MAKQSDIYQIGETVHHRIFGAGVVTAFEPGEMPGDDRVAVDFEESGRKWLVMKYANLTKENTKSDPVNPGLETSLVEIVAPVVALWGDATVPLLPSMPVPRIGPDGYPFANSVVQEPGGRQVNPTQAQPDSTRRRFLKFFAGIAVAAPVLAAGQPAVQSSPGRNLKILEARIAGFAYYHGEQCIQRIRPGDSLELKREPGNSRDDRAIEVFWHSQKIGYVPRRSNAALSQLMDGGEKVQAQVRAIRVGEQWEPVEFDVYLYV